ncbi:MAG TPA: hypothetical protein VFD03_05275 [Clostridia bacterium]|nr:hypothetical protein [Clostridia bacterium]
MKSYEIVNLNKKYDIAPLFLDVCSNACPNMGCTDVCPDISCAPNTGCNVDTSCNPNAGCGGGSDMGCGANKIVR